MPSSGRRSGDNAQMQVAVVDVAIAIVPGLPDDGRRLHDPDLFKYGSARTSFGAAADDPRALVEFGGPARAWRLVYWIESPWEL